MTIQRIAQNQMSPAMMRVASGQRINSAADDAAGLAIVENMTSQIRGLDQGTRNTLDMQGLVATAEGGLDTISDSLNRIRELSVQSLNGTLSDSNREMIQAEISQLAGGIQSQISGGVQFNGMNLLDGSAQGGLHTASGADGSGSTLVINDMSSIAQAVTDFNVTGYSFDVNQAGDAVSRAAFDFSEIDDAIAAVSGERANLGAANQHLRLHRQREFRLQP
jgi:flagellin